MANNCLLFEGFELNSVAQLETDGWDFNGSATITNVNPHKSTVGSYGGDYHARMTTTSDHVRTKVISTAARWVFFHFVTFGATRGFTVDFLRSGSVNASVNFDTTGFVEINRGASTVVATSVNVVPIGEHVAAIRMLADNSGECDVYLDNDVSTFVTVTATDLQNTATSLFDQVEFDNNGVGVDIDDIVIGDSTYGRPAESFVVAQFPTGAGSSTQFTPSAGSNWENVDERPMSMTNYNETAVAGDRDQYTFDDIPFDGTFRAAKLSALVQRDGVIVNAFVSFITSGTEDGTSTAVGSAGVARLIEHIWDYDPGTAGALTRTALNGCEGGIEFA